MRQGFEEEFNAVLNDVLTLQKADGRVFANIKAHVSPKGILIMDVQLPIEIGDKLIRTLPSGLRDEFIVDDPGYREAVMGIPAHFVVKAHRAAPIDSLKPSGFWRSRRTDFEELSSRQRAFLGTDRDHPKWLRGFCSRLDDNKLAYCDVDGGLDSEFRSKFEEVTTQAAIALGCPPDADPVKFCLFCLCSDLLQNSPDGGRGELLQSVPGGGFFVDLLASSAAYCSRLAAKADRKTHDAHFRREASSGNEAEEMEKALTDRDIHLGAPGASGTIGAEAPVPDDPGATSSMQAIVEGVTMAIFNSRPITVVRDVGGPSETRWDTQMGGDFVYKALFNTREIRTGDEIHCDLFDEPRVVSRVDPVLAHGGVSHWEAKIMPRSEWTRIHGENQSLRLRDSGPDPDTRKRKPAKQNQRYQTIDGALREIAEGRPQTQDEVFQMLQGRRVVAPPAEPFLSARGWVAGFERNEASARAWLSKRWTLLGLPTLPRGPKK
jgi:hypothetical protein